MHDEESVRARLCALWCLSFSHSIHAAAAAAVATLLRNNRRLPFARPHTTRLRRRIRACLCGRLLCVAHISLVRVWKIFIYIYFLLADGRRVFVYEPSTGGRARAYTMICAAPQIMRPRALQLCTHRIQYGAHRS